MRILKILKRMLCNEDGYAAIPYIVMAVGTAVSAYGQYSSARAQEKAYDFNAQIAEADATAERKKAVYEEGQARLRLRQLIGTQRTLYAKAGVDLSSGSPLLVLADTAARGEEDLEMIRWGGDVSVARKRNEATLARFYGSTARKTGTISAFGTGVSGLAQARIGYAGRNN